MLLLGLGNLPRMQNPENGNSSRMGDSRPYFSASYSKLWLVAVVADAAENNALGGLNHDLGS